MDRLAEMDEYDSMFGRRLVDDDFLAAGYTPQEVQAYRGSIVQPSLTAQDRAAMEAQYGTLEAPDPTLRQRGAARVQDGLISAGLDPYVAGSYSRRIVGDTAPTDGGLGIGLADFTPLGMVFGTQEGARTAVQGYQQGDPVQMGLGALEAGLGILEATPLTKAIGRGIAETASRMDPNTLYSVFGPPVGTRQPSGEATGIRAYHGSPHDFDRFSMEAIGTGEGAQAYGPGLYFAENEGVARFYRDALSDAPGIRGIFPEGEVFNDPNISSLRSIPTAQGVVLEKLNDYFQENVARTGLSQRSISDAINSTEQLIRDRMVRRIRENSLERQQEIYKFGVDRTEQAYSAQLDYVQSLRNRIDELEPVPGTGRMYELNINSNPEDFIDYDAPLSAQSEKVQRFANERWQQIMGRSPDPTIEGEYILKLKLNIQTPRWATPILERENARYIGARTSVGRGSGKSWFFAEWIVERCVMRRTDVVCVREVQKSLKQSVKKLIENKIEELGVGHLFDIQTAEIKCPHGGVIIFQGMQNHTADSIKSLEGFDIAWVEEAQSISQFSLDLLRPTIRKPGSQLVFSWNPRFDTDPIEVLLRGENAPPDSVVGRGELHRQPLVPRGAARGDGIRQAPRS
jgi:hypothetical protein